MTASASKRNPNIDLLKGTLIVLVILGHIMTGSIRDQFGRYIIYSFHMPLFLAISGYLTSDLRLRNSTFPMLFRTYLHRMLIPWFLAVQIYYLLTHIKKGYSLISYLRSYYDIYFHLWYIIGLFAFILLTHLLLRFTESVTSDSVRQDLLLLFIAGIISLVFCIYYHLPLEGTAENIQYFIYHDFHFLYYIYFVLGMMIRKYQIYPPVICSGISSAVFMIAYIILFTHPNVILEETTKCLLCISLIFTMLHLCNDRKLGRNSFLEYLGVHSLAYYLYVQVAKTLTVLVFPYQSAPIPYWICVICGSLLMMVLIHISYRSRLIRKYLYGEPT